jgi:hypothetical protein
MDAAGIDQVMIFPSTFVYLPLVENADAAYICARAYNDWVYDYCSADKKRLYPAAVLPTQNVDFAIEELRRVAKRGFKSALVRPIIAHNKYPTFRSSILCEFEELGIVLGMHTFPSRAKPCLDWERWSEPKTFVRGRRHYGLFTGAVRCQHHANHGLQTGRGRSLRLHRRGYDLDRGGFDDRLAREISASQSSDPRIQLKLAAVGAGDL